jgi:hypothetical protein
MMPPEPDPSPHDVDGERELYGEVEIERHVKPDGRALILYARRRGDAKAGHEETTADRSA